MATYELYWDDNFLPLYGNSIIIPSNTIVWRGFDPSFPAISDRPSYYGSREFAQGYADKYGTDASPFITSRQLKLLDIRFMKVLLSQLFEHNRGNKADNRAILDTTISFGLCSLEHQVKLFDYKYAEIYNTEESLYNNVKAGINKLKTLINPNAIYEQPGVRIAETTNDAFVMGFIKGLFYSHYDGYISPNIQTPFHVEKKDFILNSELVLFDPLLSGIRLLSILPSNIQKITINSCILQNGYNYTTIDTRDMKTSYYSKIQKGGSLPKSIKLCDDYNYLYDRGNKNIIKLYNNGIQLGKKWQEKPIKIHSAIAPGPTVDPTIFTHYNMSYIPDTFSITSNLQHH